MGKKILYLKLWWSDNIGNAFIDIGAMTSIKQTECIKKNKAVLIPISGYPIIYYASQKSKWIKYIPPAFIPLLKFVFGRYFEKVKEHTINKQIRKIDKSLKNVLDLITTIEAEYVIFPGAILNVSFFKKFEFIFDKLIRRKIKIIFYGCGGNYYSSSEIEYVQKKMDKIRPYAFISRDSLAFRFYKDFAEFSFDGIDCGFFVNMLPFKDIKISLPPYAVLAFDKLANKKIEKKLEKKLSKKFMIIKTTHTYDQNMIIYKTQKIKSKPNSIVSDWPYDYLILYAHAQEIHTDRVHACVAALSFGNACKLYTNTARAKLFEKIDLYDITKKVIKPDIKVIEKIKKYQKEQICFLENILER